MSTNRPKSLPQSVGTIDRTIQPPPYTIPRDIYATDLCATLGGVQYRWSGGLGAILKSRERGVRMGDARLIGDVLFHAHVDHHPFWRQEVCWTIPNGHISMEWIRAFKRALFGVERP